MTDDNTENVVEDEEKEYAGKARADQIEQQRGSKPAGSSDGADGHEKAEAVERASGGIQD